MDSDDGMPEYLVGTTIILQAEYYDRNDNALDADSEPIVEIRDERNRTVQTGLVSIKTMAGTYQVKFKTIGLRKGTFFHVWTALFDSLPDVRSNSFVLKDLIA